MYFDPLCKRNETVSPQALHMVSSDFSETKRKRSKNEPMHTYKKSAISLSVASNISPHAQTHT